MSLLIFGKRIKRLCRSRLQLMLTCHTGRVLQFFQFDWLLYLSSWVVHSVIMKIYYYGWCLLKLGSLIIGLLIILLVLQWHWCFGSSKCDCNRWGSGTSSKDYIKKEEICWEICHFSWRVHTRSGMNPTLALIVSPFTNVLLNCACNFHKQPANLSNYYSHFKVLCFHLNSFISLFYQRYY
jgi:hypothetical protein